MPAAFPTFTATCPCCGQTLRSGTLLIDTRTRTVTNQRGRVRLTPKEHALVRTLRKAFPAAVPTAALQSAVLGASKTSIRVIIHRARPKLETVGLAISNTRGSYQLIGAGL